MSYQMSWTKNDVLITFEGEVDFHEITEVDDKLYEDLRYDKQSHQIWDFREVNNFKITSIEARVIGVLDKSSSIWNNDIKLACVTTDKHIIEMTLEYKNELKDTNWQVRIFDNMQEAQNWCQK
jgi:hypothetical protein